MHIRTIRPPQLHICLFIDMNKKLNIWMTKCFQEEIDLLWIFMAQQ